MTEPTPEMAEEVEAAQAAERKALLAELANYGLTAPRKKASNEQLREMLTNHIAAKAQADEILKAQAAAEKVKIRDMVTCRITKAGDQKISRGIHIPGKGDLRFAWQEKIQVERAIAEQLEAKHYVEIEDAAPAA